MENHRLYFCQKVKVLREQQGITYKVLAATSGVSIAHLRRIEGYIIPTDMALEQVFDLARALHCPPCAPFG